MSLTNEQIETLAKKMRIPLEAVVFKDELLFMKPKLNKVYIVNMENETDENGRPNLGSHWVSLLTHQAKDGRPEFFYFDSYGCPAPKAVQDFCHMKNVPYNTKDVQGLLSTICGWFCLALGHFVYASEYRMNHFYSDINHFLDMFQNMNNNMDFMVNEGILKQFFQSLDGKEIPETQLNSMTQLSEEQLQSLGEN
jgi:hypothetical protein